MNTHYQAGYDEYVRSQKQKTAVAADKEIVRVPLTMTDHQSLPLNADDHSGKTEVGFAVSQSGIVRCFDDGSVVEVDLNATDYDRGSEDAARHQMMADNANAWNDQNSIRPDNPVSLGDARQLEADAHNQMLQDMSSAWQK